MSLKEQGRRRLRRSPPQLRRLAHRPYVSHTTEEVTHHLVGVELGEHPWLRSVFTSATTLDDLPQAPEDPDYYRP